MRFDRFATALLTDDVPASSRFYVDNFGFHTAVELDWYVSLHHVDHPTFVLDLVDRNHATLPQAQRGQPVSGLSLAFVVEDAAKEEARLHDNGARVLEPLADMPWGQRRFHIQAPEGTVLEIVQFTTPDPEWLAQHGS